MRFSTVAFTLFGAAASASASTLFGRQSTLPTCAVACTTSADLGGCVATDTHCLCTNPAFVSSTTTCIEAACTGADLQNALTFSQQLCLAVGVTLTASSTGSAAPTATSPSGSSASTTAASATSATTKAATTTAAPSTTPSSAAISARQVNAFAGLAAAGLVALAL